MSRKLWLRQVALVARDKEEIISSFEQVLGMTPVHGSGDLSRFGLPAKGPMSDGGREVLESLGVENLLFMAGTDVVEVMFPTRPDGATVGFMDRRGGDTGYMIILQTDDVGFYKDRAQSEGVRISHEATFPKYCDIHLHPRDCGGALLSMARHLPENVPGGPWYPAGEIWEEKPEAAGDVKAMTAAEMRSPDPRTLAERWGRLLDLPVSQRDDGFIITIEDAQLRFVAAREGEKEGFCGIDLRVADRAEAERAAKERGCWLSDGVIKLCGLDVRLVA